MKHPILRNRFDDYLKALGMRNISEFSQDLEDFAISLASEPNREVIAELFLLFHLYQILRERATIIFNRFMSFNNRDAPQPVNLPMSLREELYTRLFSSASSERITVTMFDKARLWCQRQLKDMFFELWIGTKAWTSTYLFFAFFSHVSLNHNKHNSKYHSKTGDSPCTITGTSTKTQSSPSFQVTTSSNSTRFKACRLCKA